MAVVATAATAPAMAAVRQMERPAEVDAVLAFGEVASSEGVVVMVGSFVD
jgi:hypothetical protein